MPGYARAVAAASHSSTTVVALGALEVAGTTVVISDPDAPHGGGLVTVLELEREQPGVAPQLLVVDGLADREVAERLCLSHHTVSQYVKHIYRKLDVESRVAVTCVLLGPRGSVHRS